MEKIKYPEVNLYHYTSLNALMAIIENKTIRLTDYRFLNDTSELFFAIEELKRNLEKYKENPYYSEFLKALDDISNGKMQCKTAAKLNTGEILITPQVQNVQYYILSLSMQVDALNMWKMYAETGCCLKFNSQKLLEYFHDFRDKCFFKGLSNIVYGEVLYGKYPEMDNMFISSEFNIHNPLMIYDTLLQYCLKRKNDDFSNEMEYRVGLYFNDLIHEKISCEDKESEKFIFSLVNNVIKPQLELKYFPIKDILEEVIISPYSSNLSVLGVKEFLFKNHFQNVNVKKSSITIR